MNDKAIEDLSPTGFGLTYHGYIPFIISLRLVQLGFSFKFLADKFLHTGLKDSKSLLAERFEYVGKSGGWLMLMSNLVTGFLDD
jgi:hypothetical protein